MNHDRFKHIDRLASNAKALLWLTLVYDWSLSLLSLTHLFTKDRSLTSGLYIVLDHSYTAFALITAVTFFVWYHRASKNAANLNPGVQNYGPVAGIACWFVPIMNLVAPYMVMTELWQASRFPPIQLSRRSRFLVLSCWLTWLGSIVITLLTNEQLSFSYSMFAEVLGTVASTVALTAATILLTRIISRITDDQNRTFAVKASQAVLSVSPGIITELNPSESSITIEDRITVKTEDASVLSPSFDKN